VKTIKPKARCRECGWRGTVNDDGTIRKHPERDKFGAPVADVCTGSRRLPHGTPEPSPREDATC